MRIDMDGIKSEKDARGGSRVDAEGLFHCVITAVDDTMDKYEAVIVDMKILAGTDESQVGRTHREWFYVSEKAMPRLRLFGLVTGATKPGQSFTAQELVGKQCIVEFQRNEFTNDNGENKINYRPGWDTYYRLDDPKVTHVPRGSVVAGDVSADDDEDGEGWSDF